MSPRSDSRERSRAWMLLLVLVPALLFASVLAGNVLLVHRHGEHDAHVHIVEAGAWHAHPEASRPEDSREEHGPTSAETSAVRPPADEGPESLQRTASADGGARAPLLVSFQGNWSLTALGPHVRTSPALPVAGLVEEPREGRRGCAPPHAGAGPPGRSRGKQRSGIAAVVTTSHAILI